MLSAAGTVIDLDSVVTKLTAITLAAGLVGLFGRWLNNRFRELIRQNQQIAGHTQQLTPNHGSHVADKITAITDEVAGLRDWMRRMEDSDTEHSRQIRRNGADLAKLEGRFEQHLRESHT